jgi:hypothetical protein
MTDQSSPSSGSDDDREHAAEPAALSRLLTEVFKGLSSLASFATRRLWDVDVTMRDADARALARPVARLIARRWQVRSDLNDATDVAESGGGLIAWIQRSLASETPASGPSRPPAEHERTAAPPAAAQAPRAETVAAEPSPANGVHDRDGRPVPGTGPAKSTFLAGFEDV